MPESRRTIRRSQLTIAIALSLIGCSKTGTDPLSYEQALEISRRVAREQGYDLAKYELDSFGDPAAVDGKWIVVYNCAPSPPPPGCHFMVVVDRQTGRAQLSPGE
jgi:hypothetical protein